LRFARSVEWLRWIRARAIRSARKPELLATTPIADTISGTKARANFTLKIRSRTELKRLRAAPWGKPI